MADFSETKEKQIISYADVFTQGALDQVKVNKLLRIATNPNGAKYELANPNVGLNHGQIEKAQKSIAEGGFNVPEMFAQIVSPTEDTNKLEGVWMLNMRVTKELFPNIASKNDLLDFVRNNPDPREVVKNIFIQFPNIEAGKLVSWLKGVYGKKYEYACQAHMLEQECRKKYGEKNGEDERFLSLTSQERVREMARIDWSQAREGMSLQYQEILEAGLEPAYKLKVDGVDVLVSQVYEYASYKAVLAYVGDTSTNKLKLRTWYFSKSQGAWRFMPDYLPSEDGLRFIGKGYDQISVQLPCEIQAAMSDMNVLNKTIDVRNSGKFFKDTTVPIYEGDKNSFYREVQKQPGTLESIPVVKDVVAPETLELKGGEEINFGKKILEWSFFSELYGDVKSVVYPSVDGKHKYVINTDKLGRSWVSSVENASPITSTGVRSVWVDAGSLTMPLYEYVSESGDYGDRRDVKGHYVGMYRDYVSKIPALRGLSEKK